VVLRQVQNFCPLKTQVSYDGVLNPFCHHALVVVDQVKTDSLHRNSSIQTFKQFMWQKFYFEIVNVEVMFISWFLVIAVDLSAQ
jgi:hypothetical protein